MYPQNFAALFAALLCLSGCSSSKSDFGSEAAPAKPGRQIEINSTERSEILPNDLFIAVWNNDALAARNAVRVTPGLMRTENKEGNTALGLALSLGYRDVVKTLLENTPPDWLWHKNAAGEGYLILAARSGLQESVIWIGDLYQKTTTFFFNWPDFKNIDQVDGQGRTALFFAQNRQVIEALGSQYNRDTWGVGSWGVVQQFAGFLLRLDSKSQTFLHAAAADGREDVILWAAEKLCAPWGWQQSEAWHEKMIADSLVNSWEWVETNWNEEALVKATTPAIFNRQDTDNRTALHVAAANLRWNSIRALAACHWLDIDLKDNHNDLAIHTLLETLKPETRDYGQEAHDTFTFLLGRVTAMRQQVFVPSLSQRIDSANKDGNTALHLAARLADPFFYRAMESIGSVEKTDGKGQTARSIFETRQQVVGGYAQ